MRSSDIAVLRRSRLFSGMRQPALADLLAPCFVQALPAGTVVCVQGEKARFLHMVVSGRVGLFGEAVHGEALVEIFGPGDAFILPAVALEAPYLVSARLLEAGRILMWPAAAFRAELRANGALSHGAALQLSGYWRILISQIKNLKLLSAVERLAALLLALAPRGPGPVTALLPGNRGLVAGLLGVAPQSLSRAFAELRALGVSGAGREIAIADPARLRELAGARVLKAPAAPARLSA